MAGALFSRLKNWNAENLTNEDLNAEIDNILNNLAPLMFDDYSVNVVQMQVQTDPGEVGSESLATSLGAELARLRFAIKEISGKSYWYESPSVSLNDLVAAVGTGLLDNRIVSGRVRSDSQFPIFLVPNGAARTIKLDGAPTSFIYYINGTQYTISTDVTITGLSAAPASQNTCLINDSIATDDQDYTRYTGEGGTEIPVDSAGTEITALTGKFAAFKIVGATTEYFIAYVKSATALTKAHRGYFFDSTDVPIPRSGYTNNDTITLMKLTWVFAKTDGTLTVTYTNPVWGDDEPTSPAQGDYWFDNSANTWKRYDISSFISAEATLIGTCFQDTTNTLGARSIETFRTWNVENTIELFAESNTQVKSRYPGSEINVWGTIQRYSRNLITWDITLDLDSDITEAASTYYFFYITENGDKIISNLRPYDRREDLKGYYHPFQSWRCVGMAFNNASSNLTAVESHYAKTPKALLTPVQTAASIVEIVEPIVTLSSAGGAFTKTLPPADAWRGVVLTFIKDVAATDFTAITIDGNGAETIAGLTTIKLIWPGETVRLMSDGTNVHIVSRYIPKKIYSFTPTGSWITNTTYSGLLQHAYGNVVNFQFKVSLAGAPTATFLTFTLPNTWNVNSSSLLTGLNAGAVVTGLPSKGNAHDYNVQGIWSTYLRYMSLDTTVVRALVADGSTTNVIELVLTQVVPFTFAVNDNVEITAEIPILELDVI